MRGNEENLLLGNYMRNFMETRIKPYVQDSTYCSYVSGLNSNFYKDKISELEIDKLSSDLLERYYLDLLKRKGRQTTQVMVTLTKRLSLYLFSRDLIPENYASRVIIPKKTKEELDLENIRLERERKKFFSKEDILKFYQAYETGEAGLSACEADWLPAILLQLETYIRASELISIFIENIDFEKRVLIIRNAVGRRFRKNESGAPIEKYLKVPKNGAERIVPLSPLAFQIVCRMREAQGNPKEGLLFPRKDGSMRTLEAYERNFRKICDHLQIDRDCSHTDCLGRCYGLNTHALRHTGITMANTTEGANVINTALIAGHSVRRIGKTDLGSDAVYTHAVLSELRKVKTPSMILGYGPKEEGTKEPSGQEAPLQNSGKNSASCECFCSKQGISQTLLRIISKLEKEGVSSDTILKVVKAMVE